MALHQLTTKWASDIDPLTHHYIYVQHLNELRSQRAGIEAGQRAGGYGDPSGWAVKDSERRVAQSALDSYTANVRQAALLGRAERTRQRTNNEQWGDSAQGYFRMIEDKVLTGIAAETHRQWKDERAARKTSSAAAEKAEVDAIGQRLTAECLQREGHGVGGFGPARTTVTHGHTAHHTAIPAAYAATPRVPAPAFAPVRPMAAAPRPGPAAGTVAYGLPYGAPASYTAPASFMPGTMAASYAPPSVASYSPFAGTHTNPYAGTVASGGFAAYAAAHS